MGDKLGRVRNERLFLVEVKRALAEGFSLDGRIDQLARARMPKRVVPGSREWDVLYRRYYDEERRKLGQGRGERSTRSTRGVGSARRRGGGRRREAPSRPTGSGGIGAAERAERASSGRAPGRS